jgi:hypothetical protein
MPTWCVFCEYFSHARKICCLVLFHWTRILIPEVDKAEGGLIHSDKATECLETSLEFHAVIKYKKKSEYVKETMLPRF